MKVETKLDNKYTPAIKLRIWDKIEKCWVKSSFDRNSGKVMEMFLNQNGDLWQHESDANGLLRLTPESNFSEPDRYIKTLYSGARDKEGKKLFFNDIVSFTDKDFHTKSYGVLVWHDCALCIGSGPVNDYTAIDPITARELAEAELVGNIYQHSTFIMGKTI